MISGIPASGLMAGGGIDTVESRVRQIENLIASVSNSRAQAASTLSGPALPADPLASPAPQEAAQTDAPKPFQFYLKLGKTPAGIEPAGLDLPPAASASQSNRVYSSQPSIQTTSQLSTQSSAQPVSQSGAQTPFQPIVEKLSTEYNVDKDLINAVIRQESGFNPNAVSHAGATGLMQLMPQTARALGVSNPKDPAQNLEGGVKYLKGLLDQFNGNIPLALAAYNAGPGAVTRHGGIPPYKETKNYVRNILAQYLKSKQGQPS